MHCIWVIRFKLNLCGVCDICSWSQAVLKATLGKAAEHQLVAQRLKISGYGAAADRAGRRVQVRYIFLLRACDWPDGVVCFY
jgi:hypothetical protein